MTTKEFLRGVRNIDRRIDEAQERADRLRARLEAGRMSRITGMPRGGSEDWTVTANMLIELERRVNAQIREMARLKQVAMDAIDSIDGPDESKLREVLELYYLSGYTWEKVAEKMGFRDVRWVYLLHGRALRKVRIPPDLTDGAGR